MKHTRISTGFLACALITFTASLGHAQHSLQIDDGAGHYSVISAPAVGGQYTLQAGGGTLLTSTGLTSLAWALGGNAGVGGSNKLGTLDNTALLFVTGSGGPNTRMQISSTGTVSIGSSGQFVVDNTGNLTMVNNVAYSFPASQASTANRVLINDGSGNLTWGPNGATLTPTVNSQYTGVSSLNSATTNNLALDANATYFRISSTVNTDLTGINAAGVSDGRMIIIVNIGANFITLKNLNAGSGAANQFDLPGASDILIGPKGSATLVYDLTDTKWKLVSTN